MNASSHNQSGDQPHQDNEFQELETQENKPTEEATGTSNAAEPGPSPVNELTDVLDSVDRSPYQGMLGDPRSAFPGKKYICPVPGCESQPWFRIGMRTPPLCEEHGVVFEPAPKEGKS